MYTYVIKVLILVINLKPTPIQDNYIYRFKSTPINDKYIYSL